MRERTMTHQFAKEDTQPINFNPPIQSGPFEKEILRSNAKGNINHNISRF